MSCTACDVCAITTSLASSLLSKVVVLPKPGAASKASEFNKLFLILIPEGKFTANLEMFLIIEPTDCLKITISMALSLIGAIVLMNNLLFYFIIKPNCYYGFVIKTTSRAFNLLRASILFVIRTKLFLKVITLMFNLALKVCCSTIFVLFN